jgi:hypothetical protein
MNNTSGSTTQLLKRNFSQKLVLVIRRLDCHGFIAYEYTIIPLMYHVWRNLGVVDIGRAEYPSRFGWSVKFFDNIIGIGIANNPLDQVCFMSRY